MVKENTSLQTSSSIMSYVFMTKNNGSEWDLESWANKVLIAAPTCM